MVLRPPRLAGGTGWFEDPLSLRDARDEAPSLRSDACLPDHGAPATVYSRTLANDRGPDRGRGKEIHLRLDGRSAGPLRQVERCSASAQGVSEGHKAPEAPGARGEHERSVGAAAQGVTSPSRFLRPPRSASAPTTNTPTTLRNIRQNLFSAFIYNVVGIPIAAGVLYSVFGLWLSPMIASTAMTLSSV
jgi:hypothetical protein